MAETHRKFDADFQEDAVRLVRETGKPIAQVARDLGINEGTLRNLDLPAAQVEVILRDYDLVLVPHVAVRLEQVRDDGTAPAPGSG